jgi:hypothetical protein
MRYQPTVNIWEQGHSVMSMQRGQWVSAGPINDDRMNIGRFCGITKSGTLVVAWIGNARNGGKGFYREYMQASMNYRVRGARCAVIRSLDLQPPLRPLGPTPEDKW